MRRALWFAGFLGACCFLTGCNKFSPEITGISINDKNMITQVIKENFQESGYSEEELSTIIQSEIDAYNEKNETKNIKSDKLKVENGVAVVTLNYASADDFASFNNGDFYIGDMNGAIQKGYTFQGKFQEVFKGEIKDQEEVWGSSLLSKNINYNVIVISEPMLVKFTGTIRYVSSGMKVTGSSEAVSETNDLAYILYE